MILPLPKLAPFPLKDFLQLSAKEQSVIGCQVFRNRAATIKPCSIDIRVGIFFDGTNNNMERDRDGKRTGLMDDSKKPRVIASRQLTPAEFSHTNIARLYLSHPNIAKGAGFFRYYIPGVGTPFKEIGELTESDEGKAFGWGGQARIVWALLQVLNAIHATACNGILLFEPAIAGALAVEYDKKIGAQEVDIYETTRSITHADWFSPHLEKLRTTLAKFLKPTIPSITVSVFGFSRGAAQAVAFCHLIDELLDNGKLVGIPFSINFLGVFDTVAAIGTSAAVARTVALAPHVIFDGYMAWASRLLSPLPGCVRRGLHCIAAHEQRMNFPVTRLTGNITEQYFPGMHSDVGGGYASGEQGKARGAQAALLSQIPLAHMYKAALMAGVLLTEFSELENTIQDDFAVGAELASAWNAYVAEIGPNGALLKGHMALYFRWRAARLHTLQDTTSFGAASAQAQQDLREANAMLVGDLEGLASRRRRFIRQYDRMGRPTNQALPATASERMNKWQFDAARAHRSLDDWETWAMTIFDAPTSLPADVLRFFDDYMHDSVAGFCLAGPVTEYEKRVATAAALATPVHQRGPFAQRVCALADRTGAALRKKQAGQTLDADEQALAAEAEYGTPFPLMADADSRELRHAGVGLLSNSRREGGGYIIRRGHYPQDGFFRAQRRADDELEREPEPTPSSAARPTELLVWSDNLVPDILAFRAATTHAATPTLRSV